MSATTRKAQDFPIRREQAIRAALDEHIQTLADRGLCPHYAPNGALVSTPDATDLATSKVLAAALALAVVAHGADDGIHSAADVIVRTASWASYPSAPANLTEVQNIANSLLTDLNTHVANATPHRAIQGTFSATTGAVAALALTTTAATSQPTADTLLNAIKAFLNMHTKAGISAIEIVSN